MYSQASPILAYTQKDCITLVNIKTWLNATGLSLTGATMYLSIKDQMDSDAVLFTITVTVFTDPVLGNVTIVIPRANLNIAAKNYYYELTFQTASLDRHTIKIGDFILQKSIKTSL